MLQCRLVCRFSDAGNDDAGHTLGDQRRKSAKARNRGGVGTVGAAGSMGIWLRRQGGRGRIIEMPATVALPSRRVWVTGGAGGPEGLAVHSARFIHWR